MEDQKVAAKWVLWLQHVAVSAGKSAFKGILSWKLSHLETLMKISICKLHDESAFDSFTFDTSAFDDEAKFEAKV